MMILEKCPTNEDLRALSLGQLSEERSDEVLGHLNGCETCQTELANSDSPEDTLVGLLRNADTDAENDSDQFDGEEECQLAMAKALGALAHANTQSIGDAEISNLLPKVLGEYEIVRPIGRGGMGNVYLARHSKLGRQVALKVLSSHRLMQPRMRQRFETEMRAVGQLSHPNIVTAHDAREVEEMAVLVTEFIDGLDIAQILRRTGKLSFADACEIARQTALALEYVNQQGLVHRDIKPSNVMIGKAGEVKLLDLGLARLQLGDEERVEMTATGQAMGTADYIAPEQVNDSRHVDIRADIYALGCTLFKMLAGQPPFDDDRYPTAFAKMTAHVSDAPPSLENLAPEIPTELASFVHRMIAKEASDRPQTPAEVAELLAKFSDWADLKQLVDKAIDAGELNAGDLAAGGIAGQPPRKPGSVPLVLQPEPKPFLFRNVPLFAAIAAGLLGVLIGFALGIIITIKHPDGTQTQVEVPRGATAKVADDGNVEIELGANGTKQEQGGVLLNRDVSFEEIQAQYRGKLQGIWRLAGGNSGSRNKVIAFVDEQILILAEDQSKIAQIDTFSLDVNGMLTFTGPGGETHQVRLLFSHENAINLHGDNSTAYYERLAAAPLDEIDIGQLANRKDTREYLQAISRVVAYVNSRERIKTPVSGVSDFDRMQGVWRATSGANIESFPGELLIAFVNYDYITLINDEPRQKFQFNITQRRKMSTLIVKGPDAHSEQAVIQFEGNDKLILRTEAGAMTFERITALPITGQTLQRLEENPETTLLTKRVKLIAEFEKTGELPMTESMKSVKTSAEQSVSRKNLKQIGIAFHNYLDTYSVFPAPHSNAVGEKKNVALSWRVAILPFVGESELYEKFRLDEDWDSEHNIKLLDLLPEVYRNPHAIGHTTETHYLAIVGPNTVISENSAKSMDMRDGFSNTVAVVETRKSVPWTKPEDIEFQVDADLPKLEPIYDGGFHVLVADGSVKFIKSDTDEKTWKAYFTRDGGELVKFR